ncbi:MAG: DUF2911 domain-containing protein [Melioribacteraceae bacterium]
MKKPFLTVLIISLICIKISAQVELPRVSPNASISQTLGYTGITITYCRPAVHERDIWGALVPYGKVWRTGANEATTIQFTTDVTIQGNKIPAGRYSLFTIPAEKEWVVILNKTDKQWGAFNYKEADDLIRFKEKPEKGIFTERLQFSFANITETSADVILNWENTQISFKIEIDLSTQMLSKIKEAIAAKPDRWQNYTEGANAAADFNCFLDEALQWSDKAISLNGGHIPYFIKAKVLFKQNKSKEALNNLSRCREVGRTDKNWDSFVSQVDFLEKQIKSKMN